LLESGFVHSAFAFGNESLVAKSNIDGSAVPPGALISFIQKGLQYSEIEAHVHEDGTQTVCDADFSVLRAHACSSKSRRKIFDPFEPLDEDYGSLETAYNHVTRLRGHADMTTACAFCPTRPNLLATGSADGTVRLWDVAAADRKAESKADGGDGGQSAAQGQPAASGDGAMTGAGAQAAGSWSGGPTNGLAAVPTEQVALSEARTVLRVAGAGASAPAGAMVDEGAASASVTCVAWSPNGQVLAVATMDGKVTLWSQGGELRRVLSGHKAPVSALRFNRRGDLLLTASLDRTAVVWDVAAGQARHAPLAASAPLIDADWRSDVSYAACATDGAIFLVVAGGPMARLQAHKNEVNAVRWTDDGSMLASCSDDCRVLVWREQDAGGDAPLACFATLAAHEREVNAVAWLRVGKKLLLASASNDTTVRVWDPEHGKLLATLARAVHPVTLLSYSPSLELLVSAAHDRLHVWSARDLDLVRTYRASSGVNDVAWDPTGPRVAACLSDNSSVLVSIQL
jgi:transducin (beta)-like 1